MLGQIPTATSESAASDAGAGWGLGVSGQDGALFADDTMAAVLCGRPRWLADDLAAMSRERGPAVALATAYRRFGPMLVEHLHGPFAFAIVDPAAQEALIAIDRFGVHGLCYAHHPGGGLLFGTTADSVAAAQPAVGDLSMQAIYEYFCHDHVPAPSTIRRGQQKLRAGESLVYRRGTLDPTLYWHLGVADKNASLSDNLEEALHGALRAGVAHGLGEHDAATSGAFLSGGLDSSTVAGLLGEVTNTTANSFTIGFDTEGFDESAYAKLTADYFGTNHTEYRLTPQDALDALPLMAAAYDEPFCNLSCIPVYLCAKVAADNGVSLLLAGDGGDELFGGNPQYFEQSIFEHYLRIPAVIRKGLIEPGVALAPFKDRIELFAKLGRFVERANVPLPGRLTFRTFGRSALFHEALDADFRAAIDARSPDVIAQDLYDRAPGGSFVQRILGMDMQTILADGDLRKVNRMCEVAGIEVAYPFLDEEVAAVAARVPADQLVRGRALRYFYKKAMRNFLPAAVLTKEKKGFGPPYEAWLSDFAPLRELVMDSVQSCGARGYVKRQMIDALLGQHHEDQPHWHADLCWKLALLDLWHRASDDRRKAHGAGRRHLSSRG
jgi:asparagine synthase (glutamine-hydrolysing)